MITYESNSGYCGVCYKQEVYKDALKETNLSEESAIELIESDLKKSYKKKGTYAYKADGAHYTPKWKRREHVGGTWTVYFKFDLADGKTMDPDGFFVDIDDETQIIDYKYTL